MRRMMGGGMAAEVGVYGPRLVVVLVVAVEMRVHQRRIERPHWQRQAQHHGRELNHHPCIVPAWPRGVKESDVLFRKPRDLGGFVSECWCSPMKTVHWLFLVSVALFISGIGFVIAGARASRESAPAAEAPVTTPVATIAQIMNGIVQPNALAIYNAVGTYITAEGTRDVAPQNDQEWAALGASAAALVESGNLLLLGNRLVDTGDWVKMTRAFIDASQTALKAAEAKDTDGILNAGSTLNDTCDTCHAKYQRQ